MKEEEIIKKLKSLANPKNINGMKRFGIRPKTKLLGVPIPELRKLAKKTGKNHRLARSLWSSKIHEARILASMIDEPKKITEKQMESWVKDFDSWDICDQVCGNLFGETNQVYKKISEWSRRREEFVKRAAFALIAWLAFRSKKEEDKLFIKFLPIIKREATDERNFVRKAVNWALRQIGKRNSSLNKEAIKLAREIQKLNSKSAKWIASDAIRELKAKKFL